MARTIAILFFAGLMAGVAVPAAGQEARPGDAKAGQALYNSSGCYECHGYSGGGSSQGPHLISPRPFAAFLGQLRLPVSVMPPYEASVLSDAQVADIYAYVATLPKPPDAASVKLLNQ